MEAPRSTLPYPPIHDKSKVVVLSDWSVMFTDQPRLRFSAWEHSRNSADSEHFFAAGMELSPQQILMIVRFDFLLVKGCWLTSKSPWHPQDLTDNFGFGFDKR